MPQHMPLPRGLWGEEMRSLIVSGYGVKISARKEVFIVSSKEATSRIPPTDIDQIIIQTGGVSITSKAIRLALKYAIDIVILDSRGAPWGRIYSATPTGSVLTRRSQYEAIYNGVRDRIALAIARAKLLNQAGHLKYWSRKTGVGLRTFRKIEELARDLKPDSILKIEAHAAHIYWQGVAMYLPGNLGFNGRNPDSSDPFNVALNYAYSILYSNCHRVLSIAGLDPYAGFIHVDRSGRPSLIYDYAEIFKPSAVDYPLLKLFREGFIPRIEQGLIDRRDRAEIAKAVSENMNRVVREVQDHNPKTIEQAMRATAVRLASALNSKGDFKPFIERW